MSIAASYIVAGVVTELQDGNNTRWPVPELTGYLNDGQRAIGTVRPDALVKTASLALVAGTRQALPTDGVKLIDIIRNTNAPKRAVRMINREILDAQVPTWHALTGVTDIKHFIYDVREPLAFYVYPPATSSASLEITYGSKPTDIAIPADGSAPTDVVGNISLPDNFANPLRDYILARAYLKDAEYAANAQRASTHLQMFADQLGIELKAAMAVAPRSEANPNMVTPREPSAT